MPAISIHDDEAIEALRAESRIQPDAVRRFRNAIFKKRLSADEAIGELPEKDRDRWRSGVDFETLALYDRRDSIVDGATKLVFRTRANQLIESVILRIRSGRTTACVSSQAGCAVRCGFCATGQMGLAADLSRDEILDQAIQANRLLRSEDRSIRNVVFMGMGEPLHNEDAVSRAVESLLSPTKFDLAPGRVLVSTVGVPEAMIRFARRFPDVGLALSLHAARQETRERIIPLARRHPLDRLRHAIVEATSIQSRPMMIEYLMLDGVNDGDADREALAEYLRGLPVHINVIPYNAIDAGYSGTPEPRRRAFAAALKRAGFNVTIRHSLGADVAAACGQLAQQKSAIAAAP